ncbi:MAG: DUF3098 domain-containing protein [Rikenellaceae bacterium]
MSTKKQKQEESNDERLPLTEKNYLLLLIGFVIIVLGFVLMSGGEAASPEGFNYNIFSWRRITLAPIVVVAGFVFEVYAIMKRF